MTFTLGFSTNESPGVDVSVTWAATGGAIEPGNGSVATYVAASRGQQFVVARSNRYPGVAASASVQVR
jgi:hypothetical protein